MKAVWLYGRHAVFAALENPKRKSSKICLAQNFKDRDFVQRTYSHLKIDLWDNDHFHKKFGDVAHQGIALQTTALDEPHLKDIAKNSEDTSLIVVLDQVTDPHNVGAITRSAAAFNADAIVLPRHNATPLESATLAKTACGAVEEVPLLTVTNLARTLEDLKKDGYWCIGLDERGDQAVHQAPLTGKIALVLGAEGKGLRRLTQENCDLLIQLPTNPAFPTLNVSNAAAVAFYEYHRQNVTKN